VSHIVTIATEIRDPGALAAACSRLGLAEPDNQTVQLFSAAATGHCVSLPGWRYPVVCDLAAGKIQYDNFDGRWGEQRELDRLLQIYATEKAKIAARREGHTVTEQSLENGEIRLTITVGESR